MEKIKCPVKEKNIWNFDSVGYLTGRSEEERPDAQVNRLPIHAHTHTHTRTQYTILVPIVVPLRV